MNVDVFSGKKQFVGDSRVVAYYEEGGGTLA